MRRVGEPGSRLPCWCACRERCLSRLWCRGSRRRRATGAVSPVSRARGGCGSERGPDTIRPSVVSAVPRTSRDPSPRRGRRAAGAGAVVAHRFVINTPYSFRLLASKKLLLCWSRAPRCADSRVVPTWCDVQSSQGGVSLCPRCPHILSTSDRIQPTKSTSFGWHPSAERGRAPGLCALWRRASRSPPTAPSAAAAASAGPLPSMAPRSSQSLEQVELW